MRLSITPLFLLHTAAAGLLFLSCGEDSLVDNTQSQTSSRHPEVTKPLLFAVGQHNTSRAIPLQQAGYYNFGVFGFVDQDITHPVMDNYLVGYYDPELAYGQQAGSTFGNPDQERGVSYWMYEGMGASEYSGTYAGQPLTDKYRSNVATQQMYYWNLASHTTSFYAYAPYLHGTQTVTFDYAKRQLRYPDGMLVDGYNDYKDHEYLYASNIVDSCNYGNEVNLLFRRLNSKVSVRFYEVVDGYSVEILSVEARCNGEYYRSAGATVQFADSVQIAMVAPQPHAASDYLRFEVPDEVPIGPSRDLSSPSPTIYYALPKPVTSGGFTFHVTYRLTSEADASEQILMTDVTATIPAEKCCWRPNVSYTYIFRISHTFDPDDPVKPDEPTGPPIIFDSCVSEDWLPPVESDYTR